MQLNTKIHLNVRDLNPKPRPKCKVLQVRTGHCNLAYRNIETPFRVKCQRNALSQRFPTKTNAQNFRGVKVIYV